MKGWQHNLLGIFFGLVISGVLLLIIRAPSGDSIELLPPPTPAPIMVHITGSISAPGVYSLQPGSRVVDIINLAGGFTEEANQTSINLAEKLRDGQKIHILSIDSEGIIAEKEVISTFSEGSLLNINTATVEELDKLPGIGEAKAQDIIAYREKHGDFLIIEDIMNVPGIGTSLFEKIMPYIIAD